MMNDGNFMPRNLSLLRPVVALWLAALASPVAVAQERDTVPENPPRPGERDPDQVPPSLDGAQSVDINFVDADLLSLVKYFARATGRNFVLAETRDLENKKITIISNRKVSPQAAYEAFMSSLEVHGLSVVEVGGVHKIIEAGQAQKKPGKPGEGSNIRTTDQYITQIVQLENVSVKDIREIVDNLASENAKVLAYAPANTLILTDTGHNIRRIFDIVNQLDIAAPKSRLELYPIAYAKAEQIKTLIEELYGTSENQQEEQDPRAARLARRRAARRRAQQQQEEGVTAGEESNFIGKVIADERTNTLIVIANDQGHEAVSEMISRIDVNIDPTTRSQIYVYRLEHAKAEDVSQVLQDLSQEGGSRRGGGGAEDEVDPRVARARAQARQRERGDAPEDEGGEGAAAVFDSGMRIAPDENTNSLVIIASRDDYQVIESVIRQLDVKRKQVFVDAVVMELSSQESMDLDLGFHLPIPLGGANSIISGQLGTNSLGLDPSSLTGLAAGVFGQSLTVPVSNPLTGGTSELSIPAFGVALNAMKTSQMVNIVSSPSLLALDNEEARIVVGRKIPFPMTGGITGFGAPLTTFQREDVAITLEMTPRINSENFVTLELKVEVQEIEEGANTGGDIVAQGGFITSKREVETVALVGDNETVVLGGLVATTESEAESKIPILGDLPLLGALFRNKTRSKRRSNLMIFITPHIIDDPDDMREVMRVKEAQRSEFMRRFYGKSQDEAFAEIRRLLQYSMNEVDQASVYRGPATIASTVVVDGQRISTDSRQRMRDELDRARSKEPGSDAGRLPQTVELGVFLPAEEPSEEEEAESSDDGEEGSADEASEPSDDVEGDLEGEGSDPSPDDDVSEED